MSGRSTRNNPANNNNENPPIETTTEVARQLKTALPNLITQLVATLGANRANQGKEPQGCNYKTFRTCGPKEFFGTEGAVGLLTWFEGMESVFHISKCHAASQVQFAGCMLQGRALTWWNTLIQTRGLEATMALSWAEFKKLMKEEFHELVRLVSHMVTPESQCVNRYIRGLAPKIINSVTSFKPDSINSVVCMTTRLTTDGINDGIFKKKESAGNKKRSGDQSKNRGKNDKNKKQRAGKNSALTAPGQGSEQKQYAGRLPKNCASRVANDGPRRACYECGDPNHLRNACPKLNRAPTQGGNYQNPVLAIEGNRNQGGTENQARGRAFVMGAAEAQQDPNIVTGTFSVNDHFATVLFDSGANYSFISIKSCI
nr:hypothetical protein [Tanacetum cinerariifolium]